MYCVLSHNRDSSTIRKVCHQHLLVGRAHCAFMLQNGCPEKAIFSLQDGKKECLTSTLFSTVASTQKDVVSAAADITVPALLGAASSAPLPAARGCPRLPERAATRAMRSSGSLVRV
jgi:hypothetical protein